MQTVPGDTGLDVGRQGHPRGHSINTGGYVKRKQRRSAVLATLSVMALIAVASCGGDDDDDAGETDGTEVVSGTDAGSAYFRRSRSMAVRCAMVNSQGRSRAGSRRLASARSIRSHVS